jgi:hypothetical protein
MDDNTTIRDGADRYSMVRVTDGNIHTGIFDINGNQADVFENTLATGDLLHKLTHDGDTFFIAGKTSGFNVNSTIIIGTKVGIDTGKTDAGLHVRFDANVEGGILVEVLTSTGITFAGGTAITPRNFNGNCDAIINPTSPNKKEMVSTFYLTPNNLGTTTLWDQYEIGGTGTNQTKVQASVQSLEKIYPAGSDIVIRFTSLVNGTRLSYKIVMYEHEINARP